MNQDSLAFNTPYMSAGRQAIDEIVPTLLHALEDDETSNTPLDRLKQILSVSIVAILSHILPKLVQLPLLQQQLRDKLLLGFLLMLLVRIPRIQNQSELWEKKKEQIWRPSAFGKLPRWDLHSIIVKGGDDCKQEHLPVQLVSHFNEKLH
ncbi:uncharacterized protein LOC141816642 isoform X2 [Curcuma longa]|uniref:uncharacterized protein LOC141816642 isoform X2 n=1 Tax=Curcuma longa TaxID=136217 RepID=UPI003D9FAD32